MKRKNLQRLRNIGIAAHIDAGKTTLTERLLYFTGRSHRMGETHFGNSQMDTSKQEIEKGITISSAATHITWTQGEQTFAINIIDTPGHVDFMIEVERSLRVLDGMVLLFDAVAGVEPQTETVWQQSARYAVPVIAMVNKLDRVGADYLNVIRQMQTRLGANPLAIQLPIGNENKFRGVVDLIEMKATYWDEDGALLADREIPADLLAEAKLHRKALLEATVLYDEGLFHQYLKNPDNIDLTSLKAVLRMAVLKRKIIPVLPGAAYKNKGIQTLLDAICDFLPSPIDRGQTEGVDLRSKEVIHRTPESDAPFVALAFKIILDNQNRQWCFFRVYGGTLRAGERVLNPRTGKMERIARLYQIHADTRQEVPVASAGDIVATIGLRTIRTGDTLCAKDAPILLENLVIPKPVISMAVEAKRSDQLDKLATALAKLQLEDPSFHVQTDQDTGQTTMLGMGELHLEIIVDKLKTDHGVAVNVGTPKVAYREVFLQTVQHRHLLKKQRGGRGLFAEIEVNIGPADPSFLESEAFTQRGQRLQFVNKVTGGNIPKDMIPAVETGFRKMLNQGVLAGHPIEHLKVELLDGDTHVKDSNAMAFERCAVETFRAAALRMSPRLMEPLMLVDVYTPDEYLGNVMSGLNRRRGIILSQTAQGRQAHITAEVPLAEMFGYINHLRTVSAGRASYTMSFKRYALLPDRLVEGVIAGG